ncbi:alanine--glyoxylate aminotransferase family protein [Brevibacillus sp. FSL K6-6036]|uniref:pyridoxal-phosphate-dependent aminotransferase family protein n=2 Tax=Brevibacillus sp. FSL K6-6036 TaxID=2954682 RepID=UPI0030CEBE58
MSRWKEVNPSLRTIMTPGPVEVDPRVLRVMATPVLGQFDPEFTDMMNRVMEMLREMFCTRNQWAYPIDGTSRSGLEAVLCSLIEPGDKVLVPIYGRFGHLLTEIAQRSGAEVHTMEVPWGEVFDEEEIIREMDRVRPKIVAIVHGETSTGCMQPLTRIGQACREREMLLVVDAVATLGGTPVDTDGWMLDAVIGGTQKCLSVPAGMAPITYNERAERIIQARKSVERGLAGNLSEPSERRIRSNYFDLGMLQDYWSPKRLNHHTEATSMLYALHEGLRIILYEGLAERFERHRVNERALVAGLQAMGLSLFGNPDCKLSVVTCVNIPEGINGDAVRELLLQQFGIEIASSFGPLHGKIWRIGTMGFSCRKKNVLHVLAGLEAVLIRVGAKVHRGEALQAALDVYEIPS